MRDDPLSFSEVQQLIIEREDSLAELGYAITDVSQGMYMQHSCNSHNYYTVWALQECIVYIKYFSVGLN